MSRYFVKGVQSVRGAFAGASGVRRGAGAWGIAFGAFAGCKGRSQGRGGVWHCFWGVCKGKKRVYDFFAADVRFFVNLNFMYIFIIIFEG